MLQYKNNGANWQVCAVLTVLCLAGCSEGYGKKNGKWVWYSNWNAGAGTRPMRFLDDAEGELITLKASRYAKTSENVYLTGIKIHAADPETFTPLEFPFSKDKNHVYCGTLYLIGADTENFKVLHHDSRLGMRNYYDTKSLKDMLGNHPAFGKEKSYLLKPAWSTDGRKVYYEYAEVEQADLQTFKPLNGTYGKDERNIYYCTKIIDDADTETFKVSPIGRAEDKNGKFHGGKRIGPVQNKNADVKLEQE